MHLVLLAVTMALVTALLALCTVVALVHALRMKAHGVPIEGRVVGHAHEPNGARAAAVVEYEVHGVSYRVRSSTIPPYPQAEVGEPLTVLYLRDDPSHARVGRVGDLFTPAFALIVTFVVVGGLTGVVLYALIALRG